MTADETVTLRFPGVRFTSTRESQFDAMTTWRAELELAYFDEGDIPKVLGGYAEFLTIRVGQHPIADLLDSLSQDAEHFSVLFDDDDVSHEVQEAFSDAEPFNRILIVTMVSIAEPLRGHDLGAYLVAEVIAEMSSETDTLVLLYPFPAVNRTEDAAELEAVNKLANYWQRVGLSHLDAYPEFLAESTCFTALPAARQTLKLVEHVSIKVPADRLAEESLGWIEPRHTFTGGLD